MDIQQLLSPISDEAVCGVRLKYSTTYDEIREAKREDDQRLPQGVWQTEFKKADWKKVINICENVLKTQSKDLQIAAWLAEAYTATNGWDGMYQGVKLVQLLCSKFWDGVFPTLQDDAEYRMAIIASLIQKLSDMSLLIHITDPSDGVQKSRSLSNWVEARYVSQRQNNMNVFNELNESVDATDHMFFINTEHIVQKISVLIKEFDSYLSCQMNNESPSFHLLQNYISDVIGIIGNIIAERGLKRWDINDESYVLEKEQLQDDYISEDATNTDENVTQENTKSDDPLSKATLEQAFAALHQISAFIERNDPQSPVATLLNIALYIKDSSFTELMMMKTKDGEPLVLCISKLCSIFEGSQQKSFDKSIFDDAK